ncbi:hypothetical protein CCACVL1_17678 [Corchorus capsularis]|uniref:Uncharacterized protein n=1 Tax=Corchorus capsularis TaxID=210143 RepID=A0A1R3HQC9_COCAP|nr:hypothetical protein CCACVL1_17678 [Corchorus capsularis]
MRKTALSPTSKPGKGKRRCISNLFRDFLPFKFPLRARRRLRQSNPKRPKSESMQPTSSRQADDSLLEQGEGCSNPNLKLCNRPLPVRLSVLELVEYVSSVRKVCLESDLKVEVKPLGAEKLWLE